MYKCINVGNFYNFVSWYNVVDDRHRRYISTTFDERWSSLIARSSDKRPIITTIVGASSRKSTPCSVYERSKVSDILSKGQRLLCSRVSIKRRTGWSAEHVQQPDDLPPPLHANIYLALFSRYKLYLRTCVFPVCDNVTWQS